MNHTINTPLLGTIATETSLHNLTLIISSRRIQGISQYLNISRTTNLNTPISLTSLHILSSPIRTFRSRPLNIKISSRRTTNRALILTKSRLRNITLTSLRTYRRGASNTDRVVFVGHLSHGSQPAKPGVHIPHNSPSTLEVATTFSSGLV